MDRIQSANAQNGQFVDPDPGQGQRGTIADAAFFNGVQEELVGLIEAAGVAPDAGANDQVKKAIFSLIYPCLLYTSPSPRDQRGSRMPSSA